MSISTQHRRTGGLHHAERALLDRAEVISKNHNDVKKMVIIATASDGYAVVDEGRIAMISTKDLRTGPRHVRWLKSIEIKKIVD